RRLQLELVDAYARGMLGVAPTRRVDPRPPRLTMGRRRSPPVARRSPQGLAPRDSAKRIFRAFRAASPLLKNSNPLPTTATIGSVNTRGIQKVQCCATYHINISSNFEDQPMRWHRKTPRS